MTDQTLESLFYLGLDLGQAKDPTALCVIEALLDRKSGDLKECQLRYLKRFELGTPYPKVVDEVCAMMERPELGEEPVLVIDATGVGAPVVDMFEERGTNIVPVSIHGGKTVNTQGGGYNVPKRDLISNLQVMFQEKTLKVSAKLDTREIFVHELMNFKVKINDRGHDSYESWREGIHDDLVLCVAIACWLAQEHAKGPVVWFV